MLYRLRDKTYECLDSSDAERAFPMRFIEEISNTRSRDELLSVVAGWTSRMFPAHRASLSIKTDEDHLAVVAFEGCEAIPMGRPLPVANTTTGQAYIRREIWITSDTRVDAPGMLDCELLSSEGLRSCINVPLIKSDKCFGCLNLGHHDRGTFDQADFHTLRALAYWIASQLNHYEILNSLTETMQREKANLAKLEHAQQLAKLGSWSWKPGSDQMEWSKELYRLLDLDEERTRPLIQTIFDCCHPDYTERLVKARQDVMAGGSFNLIHKVVLSDGVTTRCVHARGQSTCDPEGRIVRIDGTVTDVTELKSAERALKKSEERFSFAMQGANDGLWDWNLETDEVYYSPRWKSMLGYEADELDGTLDTWATLVHAEDKDRILAKVQSYIDGQDNSFEGEMRMHHKNGHIVHILTRAFLVRSKTNNQPERLVGTHVDITERKKAESFERKYASILEKIATGRPASEIYDAIALMYEARHPGMRCSMLELHGNRLVHGGAPSLPEAYCKAVNGLENGPDIGSCGTSTYTGERVLVEDIATDPKWANIKDAALPHGMRSCWSEPIKNSSGTVLGAFGMYYDHPALPTDEEAVDLHNAARLAGIIMERVHSENELERHREGLQELVDERTAEVKEKSARLEEALNKEKEYNHLQQKFVSLVSHEFRTPLSIIDGAAQRLIRRRERLTPEETGERANSIRSAVKRLISLIDLTLHSSRLDANKIQANPAPCNIRELLQEVCDRYEDVSATTRIETDIAQLPDEICVDRDLMDLVFTNLISNAIKYSPDCKSIEVRGKTADGRITISVTDHGVGIPESELPSIFKRFFRATTAKGFGGTGIGLSISKEFVDMHGGDIEVSSHERRGSTFTVILPQTCSKEGLKAA